jgi:hypothetical protein
MSNLGVIQKKIETCIRLREYLVFSREKAIKHGIIGKNGKDMSLEEGDVLAAFKIKGDATLFMLKSKHAKIAPNSIRGNTASHNPTR